MSDYDDPPFYVHDSLDKYNIADLLISCSDTLGNKPVESFLVGIISEKDGGIIAYAIGYENGERIVNALHEAEAKEKGES